MQIVVPREEIVARCRDLVERSKERGFLLKHRCHAPRGLHCVEILHLGHDGNTEPFSGSDPLEGKRYSVIAEIDPHRVRLKRVYAHFPGLFSSVTIDVSEDLGLLAGRDNRH